MTAEDRWPHGCDLDKPHCWSCSGSLLGQRFSNFHPHQSHLGRLSRGRFWIRVSGRSLRTCVSNTFSGDLDTWFTGHTCRSKLWECYWRTWGEGDPVVGWLWSWTVSLSRREEMEVTYKVCCVEFLSLLSNPTFQSGLFPWRWEKQMRSKKFHSKIAHLCGST